MSKTYEKADAPTHHLLEEVIKRHEEFSPLWEAELKVDLQFVYASGDAPAIKHHGASAVACVKVTSPEERVTQPFDVRILIDGKKFAEYKKASRMGTLAHELFHVVLKHEDGDYARDEHGRLKITLRDDDYCINGFRQVAHWYGEDSIERRSLASVLSFLSQGDLPFGGNPPPVVDDEPAKVATELKTFLGDEGATATVNKPRKSRSEE